MQKRWKQRPSNSNWGDFGENDQLGRINLITTEKVLQGIAEVKTGKTFCLSLPLDYPGGNVVSPVRFPPDQQPVIRNNSAYYNYEWRKVKPGLTDIASDDKVLLYNQYSTQWDSLAHRGSLFDVDGDGIPEAVYYNGYRAGEHISIDEESHSSTRALGIEHMAAHGIQSRGVMVDLYSIFGEYPRKEVGYDDLMRVMDKEGVVVESGDILCLWTGLDRMILRMKRKPDPSVKNACAALDGFDNKLLQWISDSGVAAIASDNIAVESVGKHFPEGYVGSNLPLHEHCLFKLGIPLGELWLLADLAEWLRSNDRFRFLLTAPPLRLPGAVGSPVTPVATV